MIEYEYKGFQIQCNIEKNDKNIYQATAQVTCNKENTSDLSKTFQTEYPTASGAENEIKKMVADYIDYEWKEYLNMKAESK